MQKALMQMNVQLHHVVTEITGLTGLRIIRAICSGEKDPTVRARFRDSRCKASEDLIRAAVTGHYRSEHTFTLRQALELYDVYQAKIEECDRELEDALVEINRGQAGAAGALPKRRDAGSRNEPHFDVRTALYTLLGRDLTQIHGLGAYTVLRLVGECGDDMTKWRTSKHFASWLGLAPGNKVSRGKLLSAKTRPYSNRAATLLRLAAVNVGRLRLPLALSTDALRLEPARPRR
jgi:transposase